MFDSTNLPLSPRKPLKKTIGRIAGKLISVFLPIIVAGVFFYIKDDFKNIYEVAGYQNPFLALFHWLVIAFVVFIIIYIFAVYLYELFYYKTYYYSFTESSGEIRKGVFSKSTGHVRYDKLQNIYVDQDFLDRIFGLYDVHYETAGETSGFYSHVDGLNKQNADKLVEFLNSKTDHQKLTKEKTIEHKTEITAGKTTDSKDSNKADLSRENCPISRLVIKRDVWTILLIGIPITLFNIILGFGLADLALALLTPAGFIILALLCYWYKSVWYKNFNFSFGDTKGEIFTQVISRSSSYLYYNRIQNVNVQQTIFDRLFKIYTVTIETAGEASFRALRIEGLKKDNADKLKDFLIEKSEKFHNNL